MDDLDYLNEAIIEAKKAARLGEVPIGAVVVNEQGEIIARGHNLCESTNDPTAHAEIIALRNAGAKKGTWRLDDCVLYVTMEPCPMCAGALINARIKKVVYGADEYRFGSAGTLLNLLQFPSFEHNVLIKGPIAQEECSALLREFFAQLRQKENRTKGAAKCL